MLPNRNGRPTPAKVEAASVSTAVSTSTIVPASTDACRCTRCHRPLRVALSVRLGRGPVCRREVAA
ncbi:MAG: DUF6011 domain-containing protein [Nocardioidaceae bacterium]